MDNRRTLKGAIPQKDAADFLDSILAYSAVDMKQICRQLHHLSDLELKQFKLKWMKLNTFTQDIIYRRSPRGKLVTFKDNLYKQYLRAQRNKESK